MPKRLSSKPTCPPDTPPEVAAEFARLVQLMGDHAEPSDELALLMLATSWVRWRDAQRQVAEQGTVVSISGCAAPHPALTVAAQAQAQVLALCKELALKPATRRRAPSKPAALADDVDALLGDC